MDIKPILIAGAGPVGLTLACELVRHGIPVRIVDRNPEPTDKSKALVVWPRTLELLEKAGLAQRFVESGNPWRGMSVFENKTQRLAHVTFDHLDSPYPVLGLPQSTTEALLLEYLAGKGVQVERPVEVVGFTQHAGHVDVTLQHADGSSEKVETSWLPACDGARSTVRHNLGVKLEGDTVAQEFALIDCDIEGLPFYDEVVSYITGQGIAAFFPIQGTRVRGFVLRDPCGQSDVAPEPPGLEEMQKELDARGLDHLKLSNPVWLAAFRINERHAKSYRHGRVLLAGDAAHVHSPVGGQGMNTGMQDAFNLGWKLAMIEKGLIAAEPFLDSYQIERGPIGASVVGQTSRARKLVTTRNPLIKAMRNTAMSFLTSFEFVRHKIAAEASELTVKYPKSPLNREVHPGNAAWLLGHGIHPGDRAPDGHLLKGENEAHLFGLMAETRFQLLVLSGLSPGAPSAAALECARWANDELHQLMAVHWIGFDTHQLPAELPSAWWDEGSAIHKRYGAVEATLYLVRPDGYVAFRSQPAGRGDLEKYLQDVGLYRLGPVIA